jgi:hypothetical protein
MPNVTIHIGSSTSEPDLRSAMSSITHAFVNLNSFTIGQKAETYWGIQIFELAVEGAEWSTLSGQRSIRRCGTRGMMGVYDAGIMRARRE